MLKERLRIPVVSNGNVRTWEDVVANQAETGADGIMGRRGAIGEPMVSPSCCEWRVVLMIVRSLFADVAPDPVKISLEYLDICREHPDTATIQTIQTHVRHFVDHQWCVDIRVRCGRVLLNAERLWVVVGDRGSISSARHWGGVRPSTILRGCFA